jgi:hypothetical protein
MRRRQEIVACKLISGSAEVRQGTSKCQHITQTFRYLLLAVQQRGMNPPAKPWMDPPIAEWPRAEKGGPTTCPPALALFGPLGGTAATVRPQTQAQYLSFPPTQMDGCPVHRAREKQRAKGSILERAQPSMRSSRRPLSTPPGGSLENETPTSPDGLPHKMNFLPHSPSPILIVTIPIVDFPSKPPSSPTPRLLSPLLTTFPHTLAA